MNKDTMSTLAGGALGVQMLTTINYNLLPSPWGEAVKIAVAFALMAAGYFMYRDPKTPPTPGA